MKLHFIDEGNCVRHVGFVESDGTYEIKDLVDPSLISFTDKSKFSDHRYMIPITNSNVQLNKTGSPIKTLSKDQMTRMLSKNGKVVLLDKNRKVLDEIEIIDARKL